jgi:hypothetical protein
MALVLGPVPDAADAICIYVFFFALFLRGRCQSGIVGKDKRGSAAIPSAWKSRMERRLCHDQEGQAFKVSGAESLW